MWYTAILLTCTIQPFTNIDLYEMFLLTKSQLGIATTNYYTVIVH